MWNTYVLTPPKSFEKKKNKEIYIFGMREREREREREILIGQLTISGTHGIGFFTIMPWYSFARKWKRPQIVCSFFNTENEN